jgi:hypothetical protein
MNIDGIIYQETKINLTTVSFFVQSTEEFIGYINSGTPTNDIQYGGKD